MRKLFVKTRGVTGLNLKLNNILPLISTEGRKRMAELEESKDAYSYDINACLFGHWTRFSPKTSRLKFPVLSKLVECHEKQLCYGGNGVQAQFAVCYNQETLIPEFTGHVLEPDVVGSGRGSGAFRRDFGIGKYSYSPL